MTKYIRSSFFIIAILIMFTINSINLNSADIPQNTLRTTPERIIGTSITYPRVAQSTSSSDIADNDTEITESGHMAQFRLESGSCRFYITKLEKGTNWFLNLTALYKGIFYIYLFDSRPKENFLGGADDVIKPEIYQYAKAYNETPQFIYSDRINATVCNIQLNYTASHEGLYYIEIVLVENGPDTFMLYSSRVIEPYFIPFIDGYPIIGIVFGIMAGIGINITIFYKNKVFSKFINKLNS